MVSLSVPELVHLVLSSVLQHYILYGIVVTIFYISHRIIRPLNLKYDYSEIGPNELFPSGLNSKKKAEVVNELQRRRKKGDIPPVYPNGWFAIAESSDLQINKAKYVTALGENFAVFRGKSGKTHVLDAYCPHLGANIGVCGRVEEDCLVCPFHEWSFSGENGDCVNVPYSTDVPKVGIRKWTSVEVNDFVFVWYHAENELPNWEISIAPEMTTYYYRGRNEYLLSCHIQDIPENGCDVAHLMPMHSANLIQKSNFHTKGTFWEHLSHKLMRHEWQAEWEKPNDTNLHIATLKIDQQIKLFGVNVNQVNASVFQIGPGYVELRVETPFGIFLVLQTLTPVEPLQQRLLHRIYCPLSAAYFMSPLFFIGLSIMVSRDAIVWNHKKYQKNPRLVKEDGKIKQFRQWYGQFYSKNSKSYATANTNNSLEW